MNESKNVRDAVGVRDMTYDGHGHGRPRTRPVAALVPILAMMMTASVIVIGPSVASHAQSAAPNQAGVGDAEDAPAAPAQADGAGQARGEASAPLPAGDDAVSEIGAGASSPKSASDIVEPWSEGRSQADRRAAREAFLAGNKLARRRFFASAAAKYRQAMDLWPHPAFAYNLALAQLQLDQPIEAHASLERAIEHGPEPLGDRYQEARQQIARIESEAGQLTVTCAEPGARVMMDGKLLFMAPGTGRRLVRPGAYQVVALHSGLVPVIETVVLAPGQESAVALAFTYPEVEIEVSERRWASWKSWAVVASGAALMATGGALDWHSSRAFDDHDRAFRKQCPDGCMDGSVPADLDSRQRRAEREQDLAIVGYTVGAAALATGVVLAYLGRERVRRERVRKAPDGSVVSVVEPGAKDIAIIAPLIAPGAVGLNTGFYF